MIGGQGLYTIIGDAYNQYKNILEKNDKQYGKGRILSYALKPLHINEYESSKNYPAITELIRQGKYYLEYGWNIGNGYTQKLSILPNDTYTGCIIFIVIAKGYVSQP